MRYLPIAFVGMMTSQLSGIARAETSAAPSAEAVQATDDASAASNSVGEQSSKDSEPADEAMATKRAREFYDLAMQKYAQGDIRTAFDLMSRSYELSRRAQLLFNLGQLSRALGRCRAALDYYRQFLGSVAADDKTPADDPYREEATRVVGELEPECVAPTRATHVAAPTVAAPATQSYWTTRRIVGWSTIGAGVAAGVAATAFGLSVLHTQSEYDAMGKGESSQTPTNARYHELESQGKRYERWEIGFGVVGAAAVTTGVVLLVTGLPDAEKSAPALSLNWGPSGGTAGYSLTF